MFLEEKSIPLGENPYWVFVSFLYAFVAADIAVRFSNLSSHWSEYSNCEPKRKYWHVPVWSHLVLAAFVIATSWLGWTLAFVHGDVSALDIKNLRGVIAPTSLLLVIDFWILGTYFSFVSVINEARLSGKHEGGWSPLSGSAAYWILWILIAYLCWDFLVYYLIPYWTDPTKEAFWARSWMSPRCLLLAALAFLWLGRIRSEHPFCILAGDVSLLALLLYYRSLKQIATWSQPAWVGGFKWGCLCIFVLTGLFAGYFGGRSTSSGAGSVPPPRPSTLSRTPS
jgi:hypothetical protein